MLGAETACRPCSAFGERPCSRGDRACMTAITPARVVSAVKSLLRREA